MDEIIFNMQFFNTEFADKLNNKEICLSIDDMLKYYEYGENSNYVDKYLNSSDAIDSYNYLVGFNRGFNQNGTLSATVAKELINQYKPKNIYQIVFAFKEKILADKGYLSNKNMQKLITKSMDENIRLMNLEPNNVVWGAYYHVNTDYPHIHLWMFEKHQTKQYPKLQKKTFEKIKSGIVRNMILNIEIFSVKSDVNTIVKNITEKYDLEPKWYGDCYPDNIDELQKCARGATSQEEYEYYMNEIERCFDYQAQNLDIDEIEI